MKSIVLAVFLAGFVSITCRSPEIRLRDNKIESIVEKNLHVNDDAYRQVLAKEEFGIQDLFILAMDRSEQIALNSEDVYQAREKIRVAWGAVLPQVSFRVGLYAPDTVSSSSGAVFTRGFRFYARQNILSGLDEISGFQAAPLYEKYSTEQLKAQAASLYDQIAQVFFQYLLVQYSLNTEKILLDNSTDLKAELEKRFYLGKVRRSEILSVEVMIAKTEALITDLHNQLGSAQKDIKNLTGLEKNFVPEKPSVENHFDLKKYDSAFHALENRPDIMSLKAAWDLARLDTAKALGGHFPRIYLEGSYRIPSDTSSSTTDYYGALIAEVPLFSGGTTHSQYLSAKSRERQAELRYNQAMRTARETLGYYLQSYQSGARVLDKQKTAMDIAQKNYETIRADYRVGQATNLEVLSALNDAANAKLDYEKTRLNQKLIIIHIQILTGELP